MPEPAPEIEGWNTTPPPPPWTEGDQPNVASYVESELFVAGALSTMPPFSAHHPAWALPFARKALEALSQWDPCDAAAPGEHVVSVEERIERLTVAAEAALRHFQAIDPTGFSHGSVVLGLKAALEA